MAMVSLGIAGRPVVVLITIASSCGFLLFGYDNGVFSGLIVSPWFLKTFHHPKSSLLGTFSAMYNVGGFLGSLVAFFIGEKAGRRRTILCGIVVCAIGAVVQCSAVNLSELVSGRIISGVGVGVMTSTVGLWQAETCSARTRGRHLTFQHLGGAALGLFFAQWINYGFHNSTKRAAFTFPVAFQLVFIAVSGVLVLVLPESPRWLVKKGRMAEAMEVLVLLEGEKAETRVSEIVAGNVLEGQGKGNRRCKLFAHGPTQNFRRLSLACGVMIMHQLVGTSTVTYFMPTLLIKFIGASHKTSLWVSGLTSVTAMIFATVPVLTVDRFGRRPFLWGGAIWQCVTFSIIAALLATNKGNSYSIAAVVMIFFFYGGNAMTWLGPSWTYSAEILPLQIREKGLALGCVCYWLFQFMMVEITPIALTNIGYRFYVILAVFNAVIAAIVFLIFPETSGKSLEEIDFYFAKKYTGTRTELRQAQQIENDQASHTLV